MVLEPLVRCQLFDPTLSTFESFVRRQLFDVAIIQQINHCFKVDICLYLLLLLPTEYWLIIFQTDIERNFNPAYY